MPRPAGTETAIEAGRLTLRFGDFTALDGASFGSGRDHRRDPVYPCFLSSSPAPR